MLHSVYDCSSLCPQVGRNQESRVRMINLIRIAKVQMPPSSQRSRALSHGAPGMRVTFSDRHGLLIVWGLVQVRPAYLCVLLRWLQAVSEMRALTQIVQNEAEVDLQDDC